MSVASEPYTDSFIVQCDRNSSLEADTGNNENPAIFTNKQGTGLRLNAGDKVSVHSAFINEIGNTDGTIEFKGSAIRDTDGKEITYELEQTEDTFALPFPLDDLYSANTNYPWDPSGSLPDGDTEWDYGQLTGQNKKQILQPYKYQRCDSANNTKTFTLKDNEMNIQIAYYKTANGENYMHLPRRFDCMDGGAFGLDKDGGTATPKLSSRFPSGDDTLPWAYKGMQWSQCPATQGGGVDEIGFADGGWNGNVNMDLRVESQVKDDWTFYDHGRRWKCETLDAGKDGAGIGIDTKTLNTLGTTKRFRWKNDNSRYMLFKKERTFFTTAPQFTEFLTDAQLGACVKPENLTGSKTNDFLGYVDGAASEGHSAMPVDATKTAHYWNVRDPACTGNWVPYYEIKNISVESGFKSPEDIADEVSQLLNKTGEPKEVYARTGARSGAIPSATTLGASHQLVGLKKDGEIFKSFYSTNHAHYNAGACKDYFVDSSDGTIGNMPEKEAGCTRYMSAYHYIGVKRPQLWITGRAFCEEALEVKAEEGKTWGELDEFGLHPSRPNISFAGRNNPICTDIPWENRHLLNKFIQAQGEYPELFNYGYSNIKGLGSDYKDDDNVSAEEFQMGNINTGETYARFIHFDLTKINSNTWKDQAGKIKSGARRLGCDNYDLTANSDYDVGGISGVETYTGYEMKSPAVVPPESVADGTHAKLSGNLPYYDLSSVPLWFYYDQSRADFDGGGEGLYVDKSQLCYGCMTRYNPFKEEGAGVDMDFIAFITEPIGGLPDFFFQKEGNPHGDLTQVLDSNNLIGYDRHFNAYGTKCIMPYSGYLNGTQPSKEVAQKEWSDFYYVAEPGATKVPAGWKPSATTCELEQTYQYNLHTYIGANGLSLNYDNEKLKRFNWQGLHTPEYIGNNYNAGADPTDPKIDDASNQVYKINKRLSGGSYIPEMQPYNTDITTTEKDANNVEIGISGSNWNLEQWSAIFDAHSGISFESFGGNENIKKYWHKCLWGLLGFSYDQLNYSYPTNGTAMNVKDRISYNSRINAENQGETPFLITNALVKSADVSLYRNNIFGAGLFNDQGVSYGATWHGGLYKHDKIDPTTKDYYLNNPAISVSATSVGIVASRQPTKMLRPFYLIKSNIIGDMKYLGSGHSTEGGQMLPIIGVVNKENGFGDYYFQTDQKAVFTITQPITLSEVKTSIHDPDMSLARVDKNSAVLYLIQKTNNNNLNVVQELIQENAINPAVLEPPQMTDAEYNAYFQTFIMNRQEQQELNEENVEAHYPLDEQAEVPSGEVGQTIGGLIPPRRKVESFLGLRQGERPATVMSPPEALAKKGRLETEKNLGAMTRTGARQKALVEAERERARVMLSRRFVKEGESVPVEPLVRADSGETGTTRTSQRGPTPTTTTGSAKDSAPITAPSDPPSVREKEI